MPQQSFNLKKSYFIGIDIGGTKCAVIAGTKEMEILAKVEFATETEKGSDFAIKKLLFEAAAMIHLHQDQELIAIGISCGGPLDSKAGIIQSPPNLPGWDEIYITKIFQASFQVPVFLQNDANACALAEYHFGAGRGTENMIFLTFGTGLGAGLILDGRLYSGTNDLGGEVGHIRLEKEGPIGFGKEGSFEGFCSGAGIARLAKKMILDRIKPGEKIPLVDNEKAIDQLTAKDLAVAAIDNDPLALEIFEISGTYLGKGLAILIDAFNPQKIVIGGVYARNPQLFENACQRVIKAEAISAAAEVCQIVPAALGDAVGDFASLSVAIAGVKEGKPTAIIDKAVEVTLSPKSIKILNQTIVRHPLLAAVREDLIKAFELLVTAYSNGKKLLICGNGGSAADAEHIVGELMKSFCYKRELSLETQRKLMAASEERGGYLVSKLQPALRAIALTSHAALNTAFANDVDPQLVFAQQVMGYGDAGDILLGISTSGNSSNVLDAVITARAKDMVTIGLTGKGGGKLQAVCDLCICVEGADTAAIQELHLPVYHTLCKMLECSFFDTSEEQINS